MKLFLCRSFLKKHALTWRKKIVQIASWRSWCNMKKKKMLMQIASWRRGRQHEEEIAHANCIMKKLMATWRRRRSCKVLHYASVPPFGPNSSPTNSPDWISRFLHPANPLRQSREREEKTWWEKIGGSLVPEEEWSELACRQQPRRHNTASQCRNKQTYKKSIKFFDAKL